MIAVLTCCAIVAVFLDGGLYFLWVIIGIILYYGWKNEADTLQKELEL